MAFLDDVRRSLSPGGAFDVPGLGGTEGVLDIASGFGAGLTRVGEGISLSKSLGSQARALQKNAQAVRVQGQFALMEVERRGRFTIGAQRAHRGFQGVTMSGSSLDTLAEAAADARRNAQFVKYDFDSKVAAIQFQADLARFNASQATLSAVAGGLSAVSSGFLSAAKAASAPTFTTALPTSAITTQAPGTFPAPALASSGF
ncbi:MAG: hypothetical protein V3V08_23610 [Nannocystaceae bacterium]